MNTETLHQSSRYTAHLIPGQYGGLVVASTRKHGGKMLKPDHAQFAEYVEAFRDSLDAEESDALCRALLS